MRAGAGAFTCVTLFTLRRVPPVSELTTETRRQMLGEPLPLRVGFTGPRGRELLGAGVDARVGPRRRSLDGLDAVVLEPGAGGLDGLADVRAGGGRGRGRARRRHLGAAARPGGRSTPPRFRDAGVAGLAAIITRSGAGFEPGFELIAAAAHDEPVTVMAPDGRRAAAAAGGQQAGRPRPAGARGPGRCAGPASTSASSTTPPSTPPSSSARAGSRSSARPGSRSAPSEISDGLAELLGAELTGAARAASGPRPGRPRPARAGLGRAPPGGASRALGDRPLAPDRRRGGDRGARAGRWSR